jgi:hypothetical protein
LVRFRECPHVHRARPHWHNQQIRPRERLAAAYRPSC